MGLYRFVFAAIGGHGCRPDQGDGTRVFGCGLRSCADCEIREFVQRMREKGQNVQEALLIHSPGTEEQVIDNLLTRVRNGKF